MFDPERPDRICRRCGTNMHLVSREPIQGEVRKWLEYECPFCRKRDYVPEPETGHRLERGGAT